VRAVREEALVLHCKTFGSTHKRNTDCKLRYGRFRVKISEHNVFYSVYFRISVCEIK